MVCLIAYFWPANDIVIISLLLGLPNFLVRIESLQFISSGFGSLSEAKVVDACFFFHLIVDDSYLIFDTLKLINFKRILLHDKDGILHLSLVNLL